MSVIVLKTLCLLAALFGACIVLFAWIAHARGYFDTMRVATAALKLGGTVVRGSFLILCAWAAWRHPQQAAWFAWGAFFAFVFSGAGDQVLERGFVGGFKSLMPTYYVVASFHALFASIVWLLTRKATVAVVGG